MTCRKVQARLSAYQDGECNSRWHERIAAHLSECTACQAEWQALQDLERQLKTIPEIEPADRFTTAVMARLSGFPAKKARLVPSLVYTLTFLLVFFLGLLLSLPQPGLSSPARDTAGEYKLTSVLMESQRMQLLDVQDQAVRLFEGDPHE